jgi:hypothetical protein
VVEFEAAPVESEYDWVHVPVSVVELNVHADVMLAPNPALLVIAAV